METYSTGAKRSDHKPYYREIPVAALRRLGETLREGALKYNEKPWDSNWQKGDLDFALDCIDHLGDHLACYAESVKARLAGKPTRDDEDHLGHLMANAAFLAWFEERGMFQPPAQTNIENVDEAAELLGRQAAQTLQEELERRGITFHPEFGRTNVAGLRHDTEVVDPLASEKPATPEPAPNFLERTFFPRKK